MLGGEDDDGGRRKILRAKGFENFGDGFIGVVERGGEGGAGGAGGV